MAVSSTPRSRPVLIQPLFPLLRSKCWPSPSASSCGLRICAVYASWFALTTSTLSWLSTLAVPVCLLFSRAYATYGSTPPFTILSCKHSIFPVTPTSLLMLSVVGTVILSFESPSTRPLLFTMTPSQSTLVIQTYSILTVNGNHLSIWLQVFTLMTFTPASPGFKPSLCLILPSEIIIPSGTLT